MFPKDIDLEPCSALIQSAFGRFTPIGVAGEVSPLSAATITVLYETPTTFFFLCWGIKGALSSNHWALCEITSILADMSNSLLWTVDSYEPLWPNGSL